MKKVFLIIFSSLFFLIFLFTSFANNVTELKNMKDSLENRMKDATTQRRQQEEELKGTTSQMNRLKEQKDRLQAQLNRLLTDKNIEEDELEELFKNLQVSIENYERSMEVFKARVRSMYVNSSKTALDVLVESENIIELTSKIYILNNIAKRDQQIMQDFIAAQKDLEFKMQEQEKEIERLRQQIEASNMTLQDVQRSTQSVESQIQDRFNTIEMLKKQEQQFLEESKKIEERIKQMQLMANQYAGGKMIWPVPSSQRITSRFGVRNHPVLNYYRMHTGIDIAANQGANIIAANSGIVRISGWEGGYGNTVMIDHGGGISTLYAHCSSLLVRVGQEVSAGQVIAKIGSTGISTGPHLHFEVRKNGEPIDPMGYLGS
jgi:murein DD-endopeptidase MepM/ murein hydrolase activator NlpD